MTVYVLAMAQKVSDEWLDVFETEVFRTIGNAREQMRKEADMYINDTEYPWTCDWGKETDAVSIHLSRGDDETIWAISEHEI